METLPQSVTLDADVDTLVNDVLPKINTTIAGSVDSVTLNTDRITMALKGVTKLVEETDAVKGQVYEGYAGKGGRMWRGYGKDAKGTIRGLLK